MVNALSAGQRILDETMSPWSDAINDLLQPPVANLRQIVAQGLTSGVAAPVTFTAEDFDSHGGHSNVTNTSRYTFQRDGRYRISGGVCFAANATGRRGGWWLLNGAIINGSESIIPAHASTVDVPMRSILIDVIVGDYLEMAAFQDSGTSPLNTSVAAAQQQSSMSVNLVYWT